MRRARTYGVKPSDRVQYRFRSGGSGRTSGRCRRGRAVDYWPFWQQGPGGAGSMALSAASELATGTMAAHASPSMDTKLRLPCALPNMCSRHQEGWHWSQIPPTAPPLPHPGKHQPGGKARRAYNTPATVGADHRHSQRRNRGPRSPMEIPMWRETPRQPLWGCP